MLAPLIHHDDLLHATALLSYIMMFLSMPLLSSKQSLDSNSQFPESVVALRTYDL